MPINHKKHTAMNRLLIAILLTLPLLAAPTQAQTTEEQHLEFMGIPIDGTLNAFARKLQAKGMKITARDHEAILLSGNFAGYSDCFITILSDPLGKTVWTVGVHLPSYDSWSSLSSCYFRLKDMLTQKYGTPYNCVEEFQSITQPNDDFTRMLYTKMDQCNYASLFKIPEGYIILDIVNGITTPDPSVRLTYTDRINEQKKDKSAMDDL